MNAMIPGDPGKDGVNTNPGNRLLRLGVFGEFLDGRLLFGDGDVALHALVCRREGHKLTRVRIRVAVLALQAE